MTTLQIRSELDLAAWELAEAESHERRATKLRKDAINRLARLSIDIKQAEAAIRGMRAPVPECALPATNRAEAGQFFTTH